MYTRYQSYAALYFHCPTRHAQELRNGTISYIQLIKREQIRPPVRPVCRRLGVAKVTHTQPRGSFPSPTHLIFFCGVGTQLSDIVSEEILYRAVVQVAEAQSRGPRPDDMYGMRGGGGGGRGAGAGGGGNGYPDYDDGGYGVSESPRLVIHLSEYQVPLRRALMAIRNADGAVQV